MSSCSSCIFCFVLFFISSFPFGEFEMKILHYPKKKGRNAFMTTIRTLKPDILLCKLTKTCTSSYFFIINNPKDYKKNAL